MTLEEMFARIRQKQMDRTAEGVETLDFLEGFCTTLSEHTDSLMEKAADTLETITSLEGTVEWNDLSQICFDLLRMQILGMIEEIRMAQRTARAAEIESRKCD